MASNGIAQQALSTWTPNRIACFLDFCRGSDQEDDGEDLASIYDHLEAWAEVTYLYYIFVLANSSEFPVTDCPLAIS